LKRQQQVVAVVADGRFPLDGKAAIFELLRDVAEIGVDDFSGENFIASADDFNAHALVLSCLG